MDYLRNNIGRVRERIERACASVGRKADEITIVAVSKTVDIAMVQYAAGLGVLDFGENRPQELVEKYNILPEVNWHMIGRLQTNKVKDVVGRACLIHSLDRWNLAEALQRRAELLDLNVPVLLQVNVAGEEQKAGVDPAEVSSFLDAIGQLPRVRVQGFMTMAPLTNNAEDSRPVFQELVQLRNRLRKGSYHQVALDYLSMGMSQDFEVAVQEGANLVRIGTSIFSR